MESKGLEFHGYQQEGDGHRRRHAHRCGPGGSQPDAAVAGAAGHHGRHGCRADHRAVAYLRLFAHRGRCHLAFRLSHRALQHPPALCGRLCDLHRGLAAGGPCAQLPAAACGPRAAGGVHGCRHAHGLHGHPAHLPAREAWQRHGHHLAGDRLRPGGGSQRLWPAG